MRQQSNILLVDDEIDTLNLLELLVDWNKIGCQVVAKACGGVEALDILGQVDVDIVVTDIDMPYMKGTELAKKIKLLNPNIKVIFLSAHSQFEYAKQGMEVGVTEYILKPIIKGEIEEVLSKINAEIYSRYEIEKENIQYREQFNRNKDYFKQRFLLDIIKGKRSNGEICEQANLYHINLEIGNQYNQISVIEIDDIGGTDEEQYVAVQELLKLCQKHIVNKGKIEIVLNSFRKLICISQEQSWDINQLDEIFTSFRKKKNIVITAGIGGIYGFLELEKSYVEARDALDCKNLYGKNMIYEYKNLVDMQETSIGFNEVELNVEEFKKAIVVGEKEYIKSEIIRYLPKSAVINEVNYCRAKALEVVTVTMGIYKEAQLNVEEEEKQFQIYYDLLQKHSIEDIIETVLAYVFEKVEKIEEKRTKKNQGLIDDVKEYLKENYSNPELNMKMVAENFFINASLLSRIFKKEQGINLIEYLIEIRMNEAVKLASSTDLRSYQICQEVGINDPNYFSKCFKKYMSVSFINYKKSLEKKVGRLKN